MDTGAIFAWYTFFGVSAVGTSEGSRGEVGMNEENGNPRTRKHIEHIEQIMACPHYHFDLSGSSRRRNTPRT